LKNFSLTQIKISDKTELIALAGFPLGYFLPLLSAWSSISLIMILDTPSMSVATTFKHMYQILGCLFVGGSLQGLLCLQWMELEPPGEHHFMPLHLHPVRTHPLYCLNVFRQWLNCSERWRISNLQMPMLSAEGVRIKELGFGEGLAPSPTDLEV
jgi:hypothetical protein